MRKAKIDMLNGSVTRPLVRFCIPLVLTGWLQMLFSMADSFVVGKWAGSAALAAVGATFVFTMIIISLFGGLSAGVTVCASNDCGAGDMESLDETAHTAVVLSFLMGLFVCLLGQLLSRTALEIMKVPEDIFEDALTYLRIYFCCMPAQMVYGAGSSILRSKGDSRNPLIFLTISGIGNFLLNLLFVIAFKLSVVGVATATLITQYVSAALVMQHLLRLDEPGGIKLNKLKMKKSKVARILKVGIPAGLQSACLACSDIPLQTSVNTLGSLAVSGNAAAINIDGFIFTTMDCLGQGCTVFTGQNVGARKHDRVRKVLGSSMFITVMSGVVLGVLGFIFRHQIIGLFLPDAPEAVAYGASRCAAVTAFTFIYAFYGTIAASLRGYGISSIPAILNIVCLCGFRFAWAAFYFPTHQSLFHLYLSYPLAWIICVIASVIIYKPLIKRTIAKSERLSAH